MKIENQDLEQRELDGFCESLHRYNFDKKDFTIGAKDTSNPIPNGIYPIKKEVTVRRVSNQKSKIYQGGNRTSWNYEFERDLESGFFGSP